MPSPTLPTAKVIHVLLALCLAMAHSSMAASTVIWSGADVAGSSNTNWSDANNWISGRPGPGTNVCFYNAGSASSQGLMNNIVDSNNTILGLQFGNTNGFHTTQIPAGVTLKVTNSAAAPLVYAGTGTDNGASQSSYSTITGPGNFTVLGTNGYFVVQQGSGTSGSHMATLDLAGLASFNLSAGQLVVGGFNPSAGASNWLAGTLYLAATNNIRVYGTAPAIDAGDAVNNGATSFLYLGQTNAIFADSMTIAHAKATCTMAFNAALAGSGATLNLNGNTNTRVTQLTVGDFASQAGSSSTTVGTMNLTGGTVNALVDTCYVARGQTGNGSGPTTGTLTVGAGMFNVNALNVGYASVNNAVGTVTGTVNATNGGTLIVNNSLLLGYNAGSTAPTTGTLNITNSTVLASNIVAGGGTSKITMNGGALIVSNTMGVPAGMLTSLSVKGGAAVEFWVANNFTNAAFSSISSDNSGVINIGALPVVLGYPSQYPLIYCPSGGANGVKFSAGTLPGIFQGYISNNNSSMIWLVVTNGPTPPKTDVWAGAVNNLWDTNTLNWTNNGAAAAYSEGDLPVFTDAGLTGTVNLVGALQHAPTFWTVTNNTLNYVFNGSNTVGGIASLLKAGTGSLTLSEGGDNFNGGISVKGGMLILDQTNSAISGGMVISAGTTVQIGLNDTNGNLPAGLIVDNGTLTFCQSDTNLVTIAISGTGAVMQNGRGEEILGGTNSYTGNTYVFQGTLALTNVGSISASANVIVSNATLDVSGVTGIPTLNNLNMTNGAINVSDTLYSQLPVSVGNLNLGGSSNTVNVTTLQGQLFYPTNITLIQSANAIHGNNFVLGKLPASSPSYSGSLSQSGNAVTLTLTAGPLALVQATVSFAATNAGLPLNPAFVGLSYEKGMLTGSLFSSNDASLLSMFGQIAPAVLRVGGNSVDTTCWGGLSNKTAITTAQLDQFAGFVNALPTNWHVIYGINMSVNNPSNCAAEAAYAANALGTHLLGFEIGNECDLYSGNGIRQPGYTFSQFLPQWQALAAAVTNTVPGWAITNGGNGWTLTGPASADNTSGYTVPFAGDEAGIISMVTQHYYRGNGQSPSSTIQFLLQPDNGLPNTVKTIVAAATNANLPFGFRMAECGSYYNGGAPNVSDAYGTALWSLDYMFTLALNGCQGLNFHGGGSGTGYTPIADNGTTVVQARPEFYGLKMFSLLSQGKVIPGTVTLASNINFTAYGVRRAGGGISVLLNNKDTNNGVQVAVNLGSNVIAARMIELTGPALDSTNGYTLGGAAINANGTWAGGVQMTILATNGQTTILVPPISAMLLDPVVPGTNIVFSLSGNQLTLSWPTNYTGWLLQSNSVNLAMTNKWFTVPGSDGTNRMQINISPAQPNVFYRMVNP